MVPASQCHPGNELVHGVVKALGTGQLWPSLEPLASRASPCIGLDESLQDSGLVLKADGRPRALTHRTPSFVQFRYFILINCGSNVDLLDIAFSLFFLKSIVFCEEIIRIFYTASQHTVTQ